MNQTWERTKNLLCLRNTVWVTGLKVKSTRSGTWISSEQGLPKGTQIPNTKLYLVHVVSDWLG